MRNGLDHDAARSEIAKLLCVAIAVMVAALGGCGGRAPAPDQASGCVFGFSDTNARHGTLTLATESAPAGPAADPMKATYDGSTVNGYARGVWHIDWRPGDEVWWGTAAYLPEGTMAHVAQYFALMRWDNFGAYGSVGDDKGGVVFQRGRGWQLTGGPMSLPLPELPEGRWFTIEVHEHLAPNSSGRAQVYLDDQKVAAAAGPNMARSPIDRLRVGIVGITAGHQDERLTAYFDRPWMSRTHPCAPAATAGR